MKPVKQKAPEYPQLTTFHLERRELLTLFAKGAAFLGVSSSLGCVLQPEESDAGGAGPGVDGGGVPPHEPPISGEVDSHQYPDTGEPPMGGGIEPYPYPDAGGEPEHQYPDMGEPPIAGAEPLPLDAGGTDPCELPEPGEPPMAGDIAPYEPPDAGEPPVAGGVIDPHVYPDAGLPDAGEPPIAGGDMPSE